MSKHLFICIYASYYRNTDDVLITWSVPVSRPFWLSPRQVIVIPIVSSLDEYAISLKDKLHAAGYCAEVDIDAGNTLNKKVRNAQLAQFNFILGKSLVTLHPLLSPHHPVTSYILNSSCW